MKKVTLTSAILAIAIIGYSQANTKLSNLVNPTAVNVNLLPGGTGTKNLGNDAHKWKNGFFSGTVNATAFVANNTAGIGVSSYGSNYGVYGYGPYIGVYGSGTSYGLYAYSSANYGAYGVSSTGYGVYGSSSTSYSASGSTGVYGSAYYGVHGRGTYGVWGENSNSGYGVYGSSNYLGVYGSGTTYGVYGSGSYGVYGSGTSYGVYGTSNSGNGGRFVSTTGYGLWAATSRSDDNWAGVFDGNVYCYNAYQTSDKNLKKDVTDFNDAMSIINKLKPRYYAFRTDGKYGALHLPKGNHYGLLAQEVEEVLPNLVKESMHAVDTKENTVSAPNELQPIATTNPGETINKPQSSSIENIPIKGVNYTELIPILVKAMQELGLQNQALKAEVEELRNAIKGGTPITGFEKATLSQNQPNPFNGKTLISLSVPEVFKIASLVVTQTGSGKVVKNIALPKGSAQISFDGSSLANGNYTYTLVVDGKTVDSKQMLIAR